MKKILTLITDKEYLILWEMDLKKELFPEDIEYAVKEYGGDVSLPPMSSIYMDIYEQKDAEYMNCLFIDILLWVDGIESDLTLKCTLFTDMVNINDDTYKFAITDILVM